jgi:pimeloyl-ACP methyl ester carboxylesterase
MGDLRIENGPVGLACTRSGTADGPPVLFLHGITSWRDGWQESTERLGDRFDCWAIDFRGHGDSDRAPGAYLLSDYASDAAAALHRIGRPAIVVGHSLGGVTAAHLAHHDHPLISALFLEDPPLFLDRPDALASTLFPQTFTALRDGVAHLQAEGAPLETYLEAAAAAPSPMGGVAADHQPERQLRSRARGWRSFDPSCLDVAVDGRLFAGLEASRRIDRPVTVLAANPAYGAAFLEGDDDRLRAASPHARVVPFPEVGHSIRSSTVSAARFLDELDAFVTANS